MSTISASIAAAAASCLVLGAVTDRALAAAAFTTLVSFNGSDGSNPVATLSIDGAGTLYGTTRFGGAGGDGTVFELQKQDYGALVTLLAFAGADGANPSSQLVLDPPWTVVPYSA